MASAAFAYAPVDDVAPRRTGADVARRAPSSRAARPAKMPLRLRLGLILAGALLGWAVPIACAATLL